MKVIKKIAAIMFALVMVISMGANVSAVTNSGSQEDNNVGSITIRNLVYVAREIARIKGVTESNSGTG